MNTTQFKIIVGSTIGALFMPLSSFALSLGTFVELTGNTASDQAGIAVTAGDLDGDGYDDLLVGANLDDDGGSDAGSVYLRYGSATLLTDNGPLVNIMDAQFVGEDANDNAGRSVATGDFNGDGFADVLIGAPGEDNGETQEGLGAAYVIYGSSTRLSGTFNLADADMKIRGTVGNTESLGFAVASAGDVNADGFDEIMVGTDGSDDAYLFYGGDASSSTGALPESTDAETADAVFAGAAGDDLGNSLSSAGDVNGDGYDDMLFGAPHESSFASDAGAAYVFFGELTLFSGTVDVNGSADIKYNAGSASDQLGSAVGGLGDVNGDGFDDMFFGAQNDDEADTDAGAAYVIYGSDELPTGTHGIGSPDDLKLLGEASSDNLGSAFSNGGNVNGDSYADILLGAPGNDEVGTDGGIAYFIAGVGEEFSGSLSVASAATPLVGEAVAGSVGFTVHFGDINGDGFDEALVGAHLSDVVGVDAGALYVGYLNLDSDGDGTAGQGGLLGDGPDCDDTDSAVTADVTYYADVDEDGLGDPAVTTAECSSTPPTGYADNASDTDDTIANNGVEIDGDGVDNDGDGTADEANTVEENGEHPTFGAYDPSSAQGVTAVEGYIDGQILVTYADNSSYLYTIFSLDTDAETIAQLYADTGYVVVLHPKGKKLKLVNVYSSEVLDTATLAKKKYTKNTMKQKDLRADGSTEVAVISLRKKKLVRVSIVKVKTAKEKLVLRDSEQRRVAKVKPDKTGFKKKKILLRTKTGRPVHTFTVTKKYTLVDL